MQKPSLGWQSWSPPFPAWHGFPRWDYSPFKMRPLEPSFQESPGRIIHIRYWCSWYAYGWNINEHKIISTLNIIKKFKLPFTHILIDDGWTNWGDWHTPNLTRFPKIEETIKIIKSYNLHAGLWFTPFLANKNSKLFENHQNWFIHHKGKPVQGLKTVPFWDSILPQQYLLNFESPEVKKYITSFIDLAVTKWGVNLLKLDFLYAPYFNPDLTSDKIPYKQLSWLLTYIKKNYPQVQAIACGAPFAPSIGRADIIRISKDTALPPLVPNFLNKLIYHSRVKMLSQKLSVSNALSNVNFDPDVRMFSLDTISTTTTWDTIPTNILGVGDNLTTLPLNTLNKIRLWLNR